MLERFREQIRENSVVRLRTGAKLMGPTVVYITAGTPEARVVAARDTIPTLAGGDMQAVTPSFGEVARELPALMSNVKMLSSSLASTRGHDRRAHDARRPRTDRGARRTTHHDSPSGPPVARAPSACAMKRGELIARAKAAAAQADSLRTLIAGDQTSLGRFRRDSSLMRTVADIRDELSITSALLAAQSGTLGRFAQDSIIAVQMTEMSKQMTELFADIKRRPFRYIAF